MSGVDVVAEHAYELAFHACDGKRVAVLTEGAASVPSPADAGLEGEVVEPADLAGGTGGFDAVILVRSRAEPAPSTALLDQLRRLAGSGTPVIVSLPENPGTGESARRELEILLGDGGRVTVVELGTGHGSVIAVAESEESPVAVSVDGLAELPPAAVVAFANLDPPALDGERALRLAPAQGPSPAVLERSVRALERANRSLDRRALSRRTSAAASEIHRSTRLERRLLHLHRESPWVTLPLRIARGLARRLRALARLSR